MFTGLVREIGRVVRVGRTGEGVRLGIEVGKLAASFSVGQSLAVNGVCLTATRIEGGEADFDLTPETVARSNLGGAKRGDLVNLEPALRPLDALDGHIVLAHVDAVAPVTAIHPDGMAGAMRLELALPFPVRHLVAEKGSVALDGISLTVAKVERDHFRVAVIPHTWQNTTLRERRLGDLMNLEADVLARYAARILETREKGLSISFLQDNGFAAGEGGSQ
ncbi:MAG: riboflavin synthase [Planctomycetota bacterium]|jgi:riboflavin synthase|nr:riboflavin synthase [Planctomycetota bacterium]